MSQLLPDGIDDLRDLPYRLFDAIKQALTYLSFDELPREERPPKRIWLDMDALKEWFDDIERNRKRELEGKTIEDPVDNEAAALLISG